MGLPLWRSGLHHSLLLLTALSLCVAFNQLEPISERIAG